MYTVQLAISISSERCHVNFDLVKTLRTEIGGIRASADVPKYCHIKE